MKRRLIAALLLAAATCTACSADHPRPTRQSGPTTTAVSTASSTAAETSAPVNTARSQAAPKPKPRPKPIIVLDPGHAPTITAIDPANGLNVSDYENEPEMHDVFAVALLVKAALTKAGYRVVLTKATVDSRVSLAARAQVANRLHAALAVSIHDQAGADGGIGFRQGNNIVYYQSVGGYRVSTTGRRVVFTNRAVAALSAKYGRIFRAARAKAQHASVRLQGNTGYDLGSRGLPAGDMWMVQLLSQVPWIYNEAGGNSAGRTGLSRADERTYAQGVVTAIERCVPVH